MRTTLTFILNISLHRALTERRLSSPTVLATGRSMELAYQALLTEEKQEHIHIASVIASQQAVDHITEMFPADKTTVWCAAIDPENGCSYYIVPGAGNAGDLCYGEKE